MANTKSNKGKALDRSKIAGGQDYEVNYEKDKLGTSAEKVKSAIKKAGNSRSKVEKNLTGTKKTRK